LGRGVKYSKEVVAKQILDQKRIENGSQAMDCPSVLTQFMGNNEAENYRTL